MPTEPKRKTVLWAVVTAIAVMLGISFVKSAFVWPWEAKSEAGALVDHQSMQQHNSETYQTKASHQYDSLGTNQRVGQLEESDKLRQEQINRMDKRQWEMLKILREIKGK